MDIVYTQPLKELLQVSTYLNEKLIVLVSNEKDEKVAKQNGLIPCYLIDSKTTDSDLNKLKGKKRAVLGGSIAANELAAKISADFLLQPANSKQFFDLGLAKKLSDSNTTVVLMFEELMKLNSFERHLFWKNFMEVARFCSLKKTNFMVASGCKDPLHLRPAKVREELAVLLGCRREEARNVIESGVKE